ncbi:MAG: prepilin-type N-terminal cleavage/methylation domain-containing protein [Pseudomonadales bacterium]|nr:prepilin-type N-terminal cleavage/methylation domain-containing protein [Pseudomonadales bacterium]
MKINDMNGSFLTRKNSGFTLIELLIVVAILAILIMMAISTLPKQLEKARDSERKSDLQKIKIAFENYHNDNGCYPPANVLNNCGGTSPANHELSPYLQNIPCDPKDEKPYLYLPYDKNGGANTCDGYRVWANLEKNDDPSIVLLNCAGGSGCGAYAFFASTLGDEASEYNYGVSEGVPVSTGEQAITLTSGYCCAGSCNEWNIDTGVCADGPYPSYQDCVDISYCND